MRISLADLEPTPDVFSVVMATGILSIAARDHHYWRIGDSLGVLASLGLVFLIALLAAIVAVKRRFASWDLTDPDVTLRLFTFVAASALLDTRLTSHLVALRILGAVALGPGWSSSRSLRAMCLGTGGRRCVIMRMARGNWPAWAHRVWRS